MSDDHGHGHHPAQAHHFDTMDQQIGAGKFGMWLFLSTEVLLFAGLFCFYAVFRSNHPEVFVYASQFLDTTWGAINTIVLLASSFTVAMAVREAQLGNKNAVSVYLGLTLLGAAGFMGIKAVEYNHKFHDQLMWGLNYRVQHQDQEYGVEKGEFPLIDAGHAEPHAAGQPAEEPQVAQADLPQQQGQPDLYADHELIGQRSAVQAPALGPAGLAPATSEEGGAPIKDGAKLRNVHVFFGAYFALTATHGLHVIIGAIAICWVLIRNVRGDFDAVYNQPVDLVGLYWHLVDLIWIFLFPLLYLIG